MADDLDQITTYVCEGAHIRPAASCLEKAFSRVTTLCGPLSYVSFAGFGIEIAETERLEG
jgi:hypothetical protein